MNEKTAIVKDAAISGQISLDRDALISAVEKSILERIEKLPFIKPKLVESGVINFDIDYDVMAMALENMAFDKIVECASWLSPSLQYFKDVEVVGSGQNATLKLTYDKSKYLNAASNPMIRINNIPETHQQAPHQVTPDQLKQSAQSIFSIDKSHYRLNIDVNALISLLSGISSASTQISQENQRQFDEFISNPKLFNDIMKKAGIDFNCESDGNNFICYMPVQSMIQATQMMNKYLGIGTFDLHELGEGKATGKLDINQLVNHGIHVLKVGMDKSPFDTTVNNDDSTIRIYATYRGIEDYINRGLDKALNAIAGTKPNIVVSDPNSDGKGFGGGIER